MKKLYKYYLPILFIYIPIMVNATENDHSTTITKVTQKYTHEEIEVSLRECALMDPPEIKTIVEYPGGDIEERIIGLFSLSEYHMKSEGQKEYVTAFANLFSDRLNEGEKLNEEDWVQTLYMAQIYDALKNDEKRGFFFKKWFKSWRRTVDENEACQKIQQKSNLHVEKLVDLPDLFVSDPTRVLDIIGTLFG